MKCPYLVCISKRQPHWIKDGKKYKYVLIYTKAKIKFEIENDHTPYVPVPVIFEKIRKNGAPFLNYTFSLKRTYCEMSWLDFAKNRFQTSKILVHICV